MNLRTCARRIGISLTTGVASLTLLAVTASSASVSGLVGEPLVWRDGPRVRAAVDMACS